MDPSGFRFAPGAFYVNDGWHQFGNPIFDLHQVIVFANLEEDSYEVDKLEWDRDDKRFFKVHLKKYWKGRSRL